MSSIKEIETEKIKIEEYNDKPYKKYKYAQIEQIINNNYFDDQQKYSNSLDIMASYLKGQKIIYMESKAYVETQLNYLMIPAGKAEKISRQVLDMKEVPATTMFRGSARPRPRARCRRRGG